MYVLLHNTFLIHYYIIDTSLCSAQADVVDAPEVKKEDVNDNKENGSRPDSPLDVEAPEKVHNDRGYMYRYYLYLYISF